MSEVSVMKLMKIQSMQMEDRGFYAQSEPETEVSNEVAVPRPLSQLETYQTQLEAEIRAHRNTIARHVIMEQTLLQRLDEKTRTVKAIPYILKTDMEDLHQQNAQQVAEDEKEYEKALLSNQQLRIQVAKLTKQLNNRETDLCSLANDYQKLQIDNKPKTKSVPCQTIVTMLIPQKSSGCVNCGKSDHLTKLCKLPQRRSYCRVCLHDKVITNSCRFQAFHDKSRKNCCRKCGLHGQYLNPICLECRKRIPEHAPPHIIWNRQKKNTPEIKVVKKNAPDIKVVKKNAPEIKVVKPEAPNRITLSTGKVIELPGLSKSEQPAKLLSREH